MPSITMKELVSRFEQIPKRVNSEVEKKMKTAAVLVRDTAVK